MRQIDSLPDKFYLPKKESHMPGARILKKRFQELLNAQEWQSHIPEIAKSGQAAISPLFSLLPGNPEQRHRAAIALGATVNQLARTDFEKACIVIRRFMWHMSEESGNIGWGIPEAFSECLAQNKALAEKYRNILISYIIDLGHDDNYCDNDILRRSCYWAIGNFAKHYRQLAEKARPWLLKGLQDEDEICRGLAAWALGKLEPDISSAPALRTLADSGDTHLAPVFETDKIEEKTVSALAQEALANSVTRSSSKESH